jgi:hypothetical protein
MVKIQCNRNTAMKHHLSRRVDDSQNLSVKNGGASVNCGWQGER